MAQVSIREYDAKRMYYESIGKQYNGIQIRNINECSQLSPQKKYVIKPDMLFGGRGKKGLIGVKFNDNEVQKWIHSKTQNPVEINEVRGYLDTYLAEEFQDDIRNEYFICFSSSRDGDTFTFSPEGGINIEENWEKTKSICIPPLSNLSESQLFDIGVQEKEIQDIILKLWKYYKDYGLVYLEVNPIAITKKGEVHIIDMVAKIDDCEAFRQKDHWKNLEIPNSFGFKENKREQYIRELDAQTGASLKFKVLNKDAKIWTLLAGGGGSLVITDSLGALGYSKEIGNYGELSGNPTREFTREYTRELIEQMLENQIKGKYLIIAGAIANFTKIDTTFTGIIDILKEKQEDILDQKIEILIRRGGINEKKGLSLIKSACDELHIPVTIADSSEYMTDILKKIKL